jgi:hypothetical protein
VNGGGVNGGGVGADGVSGGAVHDDDAGGGANGNGTDDGHHSGFDGISSSQITQPDRYVPIGEISVDLDPFDWQLDPIQYNRLLRPSEAPGLHSKYGGGVAVIDDGSSSTSLDENFKSDDLSTISPHPVRRPAPSQARSPEFRSPARSIGPLDEVQPWAGISTDWWVCCCRMDVAGELITCGGAECGTEFDATTVPAPRYLELEKLQGAKERMEIDGEYELGHENGKGGYFGVRKGDEGLSSWDKGYQSWRAVRSMGLAECADAVGKFVKNRTKAAVNDTMGMLNGVKENGTNGHRQKQGSGYREKDLLRMAIRNGMPDPAEKEMNGHAEEMNRYVEKVVNRHAEKFMNGHVETVRNLHAETALNGAKGKAVNGPNGKAIDGANGHSMNGTNGKITVDSNGKAMNSISGTAVNGGTDGTAMNGVNGHAVSGTNVQIMHRSNGYTMYGTNAKIANGSNGKAMTGLNETWLDDVD